MPPVHSRRAGLTLLELLAVVTLLGIFAAVGAMRFGQSPHRAASADGDARRLALDLLQCQRRAIATGINHYLEFTSSGGNQVGYTLYRRPAVGSPVAVDSYREFTYQETVATTNARLEFAFDGTSLAAYRVTFTKPSGASVVVSTVPASGAVRVQ